MPMAMNPSNQPYQLQLLQQGDAFTCRLVIDPHHAVFQGHFPGNPVMPGVWLIRAVHDALELATGGKLSMTEASQVKFLQPVIPEKNPILLIAGEPSFNEHTIKLDARITDMEETFLKFKGTFSRAL